jgi:hypothetical protein
MLEVGRGADLSEEALGTDGLAEFGAKHLHGDRAIMPLILGEVHRCHAALAELALDPVSAREGLVQTTYVILHEVQHGFAAGRRQGGIVNVVSSTTVASMVPGVVHSTSR